MKGPVPRIAPHVAAARIRSLPWLARFTLTAGGLGYARLAPGTWGSLPPCVLWGALIMAEPPGWMAQALLGMLFLWACIGCVRFGAGAERAVGMKDPNCVVADEVAGMSLALVGVHSLWGVAAAFICFRLLDVTKPPPCRVVERAKGGWGVLLDDLVAGAYACIAMHVLRAAVDLG